MIYFPIRLSTHHVPRRGSHSTSEVLRQASRSRAEDARYGTWSALHHVVVTIRITYPVSMLDLFSPFSAASLHAYRHIPKQNAFFPMRTSHHWRRAFWVIGHLFCSTFVALILSAANPGSLA